jgi:Tfp pilus assembly protein PilF
VSTDSPARRRSAQSASKTSESSHRESADRQAARNVFSAKKSPGLQGSIWIILGIGVLAVLGLIAYFWWQLQSVSKGTLAPVTQSPANANTTPLPPLPAPVQTPTYTAPITPEYAKPLPQNAEPQRSPAIAAQPAPDFPQERTFRPRSPRTDSMPDRTERPVQLKRSPQKPTATIENAYDALQAGKLDEAKQGYEQVLRSDPKNTDALLGMATLFATLGQTEWAHAYYLRALESDPTDATAQAGLINTRGLASPENSESRLKTALASQPDSSTLLFALGNLYARQNRWSEAQQAYFRAYSTEPDNADFVYNLAVSLDHLRQNRLAIQYYQMALNAAQSRHKSFDSNQVNERIRQLQP